MATDDELGQLDDAWRSRMLSYGNASPEERAFFEYGFYVGVTATARIANADQRLLDRARRRMAEAEANVMNEVEDPAT